MAAPVFEEFEPGSDCDCPGCAELRRGLARVRPIRLGGHRAPQGARRALVVAATAGSLLGGAQLSPAAAQDRPAWSRPVAADDSDTPQGGRGPLAGPAGPASGTPGGPGRAAPRTTTRDEIIDRATAWIDAKVPYDMGDYWSDGYRQDCSGFVSMAWDLGTNEWTGSLAAFGERITKDQLQPGDILLFHNQANPEKGSHVTIFGGWTDSGRTNYIAYEQTPPNARKRTTPYAYWSNSSRYIPYRYRGLETTTAGSGAASTPSAYPGAASFGPGTDNASVTRLGQMLTDRGGARFYASGPGPRWSEADRAATQAFQRAQGWTGTDADGLPGPRTWDYLVRHRGRDIPAAGTPQTPGNSRASGGAEAAGGDGTGAQGAPGPLAGASASQGRATFRARLTGRHGIGASGQLLRQGCTAHDGSAPGSRWSGSDRRATTAGAGSAPSKDLPES